MKAKLLWASALALVLALGALLISTEGRYLQFIKSLGEVDTQMVWAKTDVASDKTTLTFDVVFHNSSKLPMSVEALNTQMYLGTEAVGGYSITEGSYAIAPQSQSRIALVIPLWEARRQLVEQAKAQGQSLHLEGRARVRIGVGKTELRTFYNVQGTFSLQDHGL